VYGLVRDISEILRQKQMITTFQKLESLGILAGGIAHDFNNILTIIFGYIETASRKSSEENVKEYLNKSLAAMDRARALTGQLLTFAKGGAPLQK
jgi:signal transduction histidine kinase